MLFLGLLDLAAAGLLVASIYTVTIPNVVIFIFAGYLILKGIIFIRDIGSLMDIFAGALLVVTVYLAVPTLVLSIFAVLVGIKGVLSLLGGARL